MKSDSKNKVQEPRINSEIKGHDEVRLIYKEHSDRVSENDFNKVVPWKEAVETANRMGLDLIEINSKTTPIIVKLEEYSKYMYEQKKMLKQRNHKSATLKEVRLTPNISRHDMEIKFNRAKEFIEGGDKVKLVLNMKGRELSRREESKKPFYEFIEMMVDSGVSSFECPPRDEDKKSYVIFKKK